jgi:hypothetical protein
VVEARVEGVNAAVSGYEAQMSTFFEQLMTEEDPSRIATMAETLPDPPSLSAVAASIVTAPVAPVEVPPAPEPTADVEPEAAAEAEPVAEAEAEAQPEAQPEAEVVRDFAAAEAEAASFTGDTDEDDTAANAHAAETLAADDATPLPDADLSNAENHTSGERATSRVVVLGLVSVASIATFKRSLGRVQGVSAIGVASGPDGEFVFTVSHDSSLDLAAAITGLPGFEAKITAQNTNGLEVAAHDPDSAD